MIASVPPPPAEAAERYLRSEKRRMIRRLREEGGDWEAAQAAENVRIAQWDAANGPIGGQQ